MTQPRRVGRIGVSNTILPLPTSRTRSARGWRRSNRAHLFFSREDAKSNRDQPLPWRRSGIFRRAKTEPVKHPAWSATRSATRNVRMPRTFLNASRREKVAAVPLD